MWKESPMVRGWPSNGTKPAAKSAWWVRVHSDVPSPCTTIYLPCRIRPSTVQPPSNGTVVRSYVCDGRTIVAGKPSSRYAATSRSSQAILPREYCRNISIIMTLVVGIVAALVGTALAGALGVADTDGIDWTELGLQVLLAAVGVGLISSLRSRSRVL
jgi:uncharacterized membrane protein YeaQ/YmgE (transglycosylase-associated protein family)